MTHPTTQSGDTIGSYVVERPLGEGGFAQVWLAHHAILHSKHAIKLLDPQWLVNERMRERFLAEGRILAQMRHPNLVAVTDVLVEYPHRVGLVMEFVEGRALSDHIAQGPIPLARAAPIVQGILDGVGYAHGRGIVHRDLKPANVIVVEDGDRPRPVVLDFGIAKVLDDPDVDAGARQRTRLAARLGTPEYMSPEQVASSTQVDARSDVWALGVVLHELLTGQPPFVGATPDAIYTQILRDDYHPPPAQPPTVQAVLRKALARSPADRFVSCKAFSEALQAAVAATDRGVERRGSAAPTLGFERQTQVEPEVEPQAESDGPAAPASMPPAPAEPAPRKTLSTGGSLVIGAFAGAALVAALVCGGLGGAWWAWSSGWLDRPPGSPAAGTTPDSRTAAPAVPPQVPPQVPAQPPADGPPKQEPPKQEPPKQDPPKQDPPKQEPPKQPPPKQEPPKQPPKQEPPKAPEPPPPPARPPDAQLIQDVWNSYKHKLDACTRMHGDKVSSAWKVLLDIRADGTVRSARASGAPHNDQVAACIETNLKTRAQFGALASDNKLTVNVTLPPKPAAPQRP
ncbi:MAG TPA: serine/threonine-protein kinase [Myxococcota bacterium]|nr:serine/threonine-protein kinase [Myxococcota bacterium]